MNKKQCMAILLDAYFTGQAIPVTYTIDTNVYKLQENAFDVFRLAAEQFKPSEELSKMMKNMSSTLSRNPISNLVGFLQSLLNEREKILGDFDRLPCDFRAMDTRDTYRRLLDKVRGCRNVCPCCHRPCDVDHTRIKSQPGSQDNEHRCLTGHALRAMNGYKFEETEEASLWTCEQIKDDQIVVVDNQRYLWSEFKSNHSHWKFESNFDRDDLDRLHGKFLLVWQKIGRNLCEKYNMKFVTNNVASSPRRQALHYILILDGSASMHGQRWEDLIRAVQQFLIRRRELGVDDRISIIVFSTIARIVYLNERLDRINVTKIECIGQGTNFAVAFRAVKECIDQSRTNLQYAIVFMSDGEGVYPERELEQLRKTHAAVIKRFWTLSLGDSKPFTVDILEKINKKMNGSFYDVPASTDLIKAYVEVATKDIY